MKKLYLLFSVLLFAVGVSGQIKGVVVDDAGVPLMGVIIQAESGASVTSDFDGYFELNVPEGTPLEVAFLGYKSQHVKATPTMRIVLQRTGAKPKKATTDANDSWQMFILANGMTSVPFSPAVGLTIGMVKQAGWYVNAMTGFGGHFKAYDKVSDKGYFNYGSYSDMPFYTGNKSSQTLSVTAGGVVRCGNIPLYWYGGLGYGFKSITFETNNNKWVVYRTNKPADWSPLHSLALETGLMGNIKGFAISVGYEVLVGFDGPSAAHEIKIGLGGMFDLKRRAEK